MSDQETGMFSREDIQRAIEHSEEMLIKPFPIQGDHNGRKPSTIPWWLAQIAYEAYIKQYGDKQTLQRIAERGGFGRQELIELLRYQSSKPTIV